MKIYCKSLLTKNSSLKSISKCYGEKPVEIFMLTLAFIYMELAKLKMSIKAFVMSQFSHCLLVLMFHDRNLNDKINKIHERALRIAC